MTDVTIAGTRTRWVGVGHAVAEDDAAGEAAGREAAAAAVQGADPALVLVFASPFTDLGAVARGVRAQAGPDTPTLGCTTAGEIAGLTVGSGHVVVVALGGPGLEIRTASADLADGPRAAGSAAASCMDGIDRPHRALLLLYDGLFLGRSEIVRGAYSVAGAGVALVGGGAGDELAMRRTRQLHGDRVLANAVVAAAIGSDAPIGVGVGHGWRRVGEPIVVTASTNERILTLDDRPALDCFLERLGAPPGVDSTDETWRIRALSHPLGLSRPGGEEVRAVIGVDFEERSLLCGDVPQGTMVWIMDGDAESVQAGTGIACDEMLASLGGHPPVGVVAFDCAARRNLLGPEGTAREAEILTERLGAPVGGFYTYGEIARTRGSRGVHNATLVLLGLA
ncbi:MAG: FIST C-terminal domain-containing protein [Solirubrobacteraceae bacterium]|nr:FIST C-terminal domain-containing protein [Solirubrobacteraceae bacterium]